MRHCSMRKGRPPYTSPGLFILPEVPEMHGCREWLCFALKRGVSLLHPFSSFLLKEMQNVYFG